MAREMYLVGVSEDELKKTDPETPKTPKKKWENFWYHYKWVVLGSAAALIALTVIIVQSVTRPRYDYRLMLITENGLGLGADPNSPVFDQEKYLADQLALYGKDINGDGKVLVSVEPLTLQDSTGMGVSFTKLAATLSSGDVMLFAFDKKGYEDFLKRIDNNEEFFALLEGSNPGVSEDKRYWNWKDDPRHEGTDFASYPDDLYFVVRAPAGTADKNIALSEQCMELLRAYMTDTPLSGEDAS